MARNVLVSLVSDQTIQNVLFIKELKEIEKYLFISTDKMENQGKSEWIINACKLNEYIIEKIKVIEDSPWDIEDKLSKIKFEDNDEIYVNLTGGTKIMSIGVYNFFTRKRPANIYYIPAGKNIYRRIFPEFIKKDNDLNFRIGLINYLESYGISILLPDRINRLCKTSEYTVSFYKTYSKADNTFFSTLEKLRKYWRSQRKNIFKIEDIENTEKQYQDLPIKIEYFSDFLTKINFPLNEKQFISKDEVEYLTGGWFEEYCYLTIKKEKKLKDEFIGINIEISRGQEKNEFDIMYVKNNVLNVIECKSAITKIEGRSQSSFMNEIIHKLTALRKDFGLFVNSYIYTMTDMKKNKEINYSERCETFNIKLVDNLSYKS